MTVQTRGTARWMRTIDERILELCDEYGLVSMGFLTKETPGATSKARVRRRCELLADADLLYYPVMDMVELTTWGRLYLKGEVDVGLHAPPWVIHPVVGYELSG